jgi:DNA-binding transcriptional LysR family regulator
MLRLDSDLLRTFLAITEAGSVSAGAAVIGRSQSATSLQIKQLEDTVGRPLFHRHGRGVTLTAAGERLVPTARRVTTSLDRALAELRDDGLRGRVRIGIPEDSGAILTRIVADFGTRHPDVELQVHCTLGTAFDTALRSGALDLAVFGVAAPADGDEILREDALVWMCRPGSDVEKARVLPVALFDRDCWWRDVALADLETAGRRHRIVFMSESSAGVRSAVRAGVAAGLLGRDGPSDELVPLAGMNSRHRSFLVLRSSATATGAVCEAVRQAIRQAFRGAPKTI